MKMLVPSVMNVLTLLQETAFYVCFDTDPMAAAGLVEENIVPDIDRNTKTPVDQQKEILPEYALAYVL